VTQVEARKRWVDWTDRTIEAIPQNPRTTADLSSRERSDLMDRTVQQVRDLTAACNALYAQVKAAQDSIGKWQGAANADLTEHNARIGELELGVSRFRSRSFLARLRWILTGR
jgi:hypothetical protein